MRAPARVDPAACAVDRDRLQRPVSVQFAHLGCEVDVAASAAVDGRRFFYTLGVPGRPFEASVFPLP